MAEKYVRRSRQYIREEGESKKKKEEKHWERTKDEYEKKKRERERRVVTQLYRLRLFCLRRLVSCRISVFGVASSGPSNPESRHSLSGAGTNLSVKSWEVAMKLTSEKKEDGVVNFLSSLLLLGSFLLFLSSFPPHFRGVHITN